jgi:hypothetical protein
MTMKIFAQALTDLGDATAAHQSKGRTHRSLAEPLIFVPNCAPQFLIRSPRRLVLEDEEAHRDRALLLP